EPAHQAVHRLPQALALRPAARRRPHPRPAARAGGLTTIRPGRANMRLDRVAVVEEALDAALSNLPTPSTLLADDEPVALGSSLTAATAREVFEDQIRSRVLDVVARELKATGDGFYTISSAGHEDNAVVGTQLRATDPCFLHYRAGGLVMS